MHHLQQKGLEKLIEFLQSIKCEYKIIDNDGKIFTNMTEKKTKKNKPHYPTGALTAHVKKYAENIKIGDVISIPVGEYDTDRLASVASSYFSHKLGKGSCTTHRTKDGVEILRMY